MGIIAMHSHAVMRVMCLGRGQPVIDSRFDTRMTNNELHCIPGTGTGMRAWHRLTFILKSLAWEHTHSDMDMAAYVLHSLARDRVFLLELHVGSRAVRLSPTDLMRRLVWHDTRTPTL